MKSWLTFIPVLLLILVNSCAQADTLSISNDMGTAVGQTQTAIAWTAIPTQTLNPNATNMVNWLNADLSSTTNSLEATLDAKYSVTNISFLNVPNSSDLIFRVDVGCICMNSADCCIPERTFVAIIESMKKTSLISLVQVPGEVRQMIVVCSDPKAKSQLGAIFASWQDVQGYLQGNVLGYQLGSRVYRSTVP